MAALRSDPGVEFGRRKSLNRDRHEAMAHTAQFRTLTIINARLFYGKSPFVDATRNRILFQPESWNGKAVNDVGPRQQNFDGRTEEHTSELQSLLRTSYAVFCLKK